MRCDLSETDWYAQLEGQNTEEAWNTIKTRLTRLRDQYVPVRSRRPPNRLIWMNRDILRAMGRKRRLWRKIGNSEPSVEYIQAEKKLRNLIRNA